MASINTNVNGIAVSVTKQPDGTITFSADNWPGSSFGPNNEPVPGHCGGPLTEQILADTISTGQDRIAGQQYIINDALAQINDTTRDPPYDPAYIANLKTQVESARSAIDTIQQSQSAFTSLQSQISSLTDQVNAADTTGAPAGEAQTNEQADAAAAQGTSSVVASASSSSGEESTTNSTPNFKTVDTPDPDASAMAGQVAYDDDGNLLPGYELNEYGDPVYSGGGSSVNNTAQNNPPSTATDPNGSGTGNREDGVPGSKASSPAPATWAGAKDMRVMIKVPPDYVKNMASSEVRKVQGILFPYTPQISYDTQASYGNSNPLHSNYTQYFFKNSSIGAITISGKWTVQNEVEVKVWMSVVELSRLLTKMPFGSDKYAGSAPPVCRLNGYGDWIFNNIPVAITSFKFDLPDGVDYISVSSSGYGNTLVPTVSTLSYTLIPMYSRQEIRDFGVDKWIAGQLTGKGYL